MDDGEGGAWPQVKREGVFVRYTQKDIRRMLGLSRDALRLYERRGIIQPYVDPENGYRWYDDWDVNALWEMRRYQALGFSLAQTQRLQQQEDLPGIRDDVATRLSGIEEDLRNLALVRDDLRAYLADLSRVEGGLGHYAVEESEDLLFLPAREDHDLLLEGASARAADLVNSNMALCRPAFLFPDLSEDRYFWGFAIPVDTLKAMGVDVGKVVPEDGVVHIDGGPALSTYVDAGERGHFGLRLFGGLVEEACRRGLSPRGSIFGYILTRAHDGRGFHRYLHAWLPVEG